jgi:transcriptional regulator with XRE-family HTH domain
MVNKMTERELKKRRILQGSLKVFGLKQKELAVKIGVEPSMISHLFCGRKFAPETFAKVIRILKTLQ